MNMNANYTCAKDEGRQAGKATQAQEIQRVLPFSKQVPCFPRQEKGKQAQHAVRRRINDNASFDSLQTNSVRLDNTLTRKRERTTHKQTERESNLMTRLLFLITHLMFVCGRLNHTHRYTHTHTQESPIIIRMRPRETGHHERGNTIIHVHDFGPKSSSSSF